MGTIRKKNPELKQKFIKFSKAKGFDEKENYKRLDTSKEFYYKFSNGLCNCPKYMREKICEVLDVEASEIWSESI